MESEDIDRGNDKRRNLIRIVDDNLAVRCESKLGKTEQHHSHTLPSEQTYRGTRLASPLVCVEAADSGQRAAGPMGMRPGAVPVAGVWSADNWSTCCVHRLPAAGGSGAAQIAAPNTTRHTLSAARCPLSAARCPIIVPRFPLSALRCPLSAVRCRLSSVRYPAAALARRRVFRSRLSDAHCPLSCPKLIDNRHIPELPDPVRYRYSYMGRVSVEKRPKY